MACLILNDDFTFFPRVDASQTLASLNLVLGNPITSSFEMSLFSCTWKTRMEDVIHAKDYELWVRIIDGPLIPTVKDSEGKNVPKSKENYREANYKMLGKNAKAKCILVCGLGPDEFNRMSSCTSAKQIWDTLQNAHEGTTQV